MSCRGALLCAQAIAGCTGADTRVCPYDSRAQGVMVTVDAAWVALSLVEHVGAKKLRALLAHFDGDLAAALNADAATLRRVPGIGVKIAASIRAVDLAAVAAEIPRWQDAGIALVTLNDPTYPAVLRDVDDAPPTLFVAGALCAGRAVAVVGRREPTKTAAESARQIGYELAARGLVVVSGLALGIDSAAHIGALAHPNGATMAVLGSGVLNVYPPGNRALGEAIRQRGALLSEVHPDAQPKPSTLVARNRIISGLCEAVIIVETERDGGAMHAARRAVEQGRRVCTLESDASGNQDLIAAGVDVITADLSGF